MSKYEALVNLTVEVDADTEESAQEAIYGEFTKRLLDGVLADNMFNVWAEVVQLEKMEEQE